MAFTSAEEAQILDSLNFSTSKDVLKNTAGSPLEQLLNGLASDITEQLKVSLDNRGVNASYNLRQSIQPTHAIHSANEVSVSIQADYYWKFVEFGFNGWKTFRGAPNWSDLSIEQPKIQTWMIDRGITPRNGETMEQASFAITKYLKREGKEARPFFADVVNEKTIEYLKKPIEKLLRKSIEIRILEPWQ